MQSRSDRGAGLVFVWLCAGLPAGVQAQAVAAAPEAISVGAQAAAQSAAQPTSVAAAADAPASVAPDAPASSAPPPTAPLAPAEVAAPAPAPQTNALPPAPPSARRPSAPDSAFDWPAPRASSAHKHNFYLRLNLGLLAQHAGYARDPNMGAGAFAVAAGGAVSEQFVVFGELNVTGNDDVHGGGAGMVGAGVAYVLPEPGIYFSAAVGPSRGSYRVDGDTTSSTDVRDDSTLRNRRDTRNTSVGVGLSALVGKEWLIDQGPFGLGVAAFGRFSSLGSSNYRALGLALSGTYY